MADILSYRGDAGLGLGSNGAIPVSAKNPNLDQIVDATKNVMLLDNQWNMERYKQKIKDRDTFNEMILQGQVAQGEILPEYQPVFDAANKELKDFFYEKGDQLTKDPKVYRQYLEKVQNLRDVAAHAQTNTREFKKLEAEKATQTLPSKQKDYENHISTQKKKPFWNPVDPYQKLHDINFDTFDKFVTPVKTTFNDMKNPFGSYDETAIDYKDILRNARGKYLEGQAEAEDIRGLVTKFQQYNPEQLTATLSAMDNQIKKYNKDRGLTGADAVPYVSRGTVDGVPIIQDSDADFAAKYALANQSAFVTRTAKFNKELADYGLKQQKAALDAKKLGLDQAKANAYIRHMGALDKKLNASIQAAGGGTEVIKQYNDFIDNIQPQSLINKSQPTKRIDAIFTNNLPAGYKFNAGPVVNSKGKLVPGELEPFMSAKGKPYYMPKYVDAQTGNQINPDALPPPLMEGYNLSKQRRGREKMSTNEYVKELLKAGALEMVIRGKNGSANYTSMLQSAKLINVQSSTKGEENVMTAPDAPNSTYNQDEE